MRSRFVISENDRRSILSMYGLLTEEEVEYTFVGTIKDSKGNYVELCKVYIIDDSENLVKNESGNVIATNSDERGKYSLTAKLDNTKKYKLRFRSSGESDLDVNLSDMSKTKQEINAEFKEKLRALNTVKLVLYKGINFNLTVEDKNKKGVKDYLLVVEANEEIIFKKNINESNKSLLFISDGTETETMPIGEKKLFNKKNQIIDIDEENAIDKITRGGKIKFSVSKKGYKSQNKSVGYEKYTASVRLASQEDKDGNLTISKDEGYDVVQSPRPKIPVNIILNPAILTIKVIDLNTKKPLKDVNIQELSKNGSFVTDENGEITLSNDYKFVSLVLKKEGYKSKNQEFDVDEDTNEIVIKLQSKSGENFSINDEMVDTFKDSMFSVYGRGKTEISNKEAIRIAKVDAIDKFIKKHKRVYGKIDIKNLDPDIEYELTYGRPLSKSEKIGEYSYILKFSKKDIKQYLSQFLEKEGIKIEKQPFEFEKATLDEAINDAYMNRKELMVVLGISNDEDTIDLVKELKGGGIDKKYLPIFIKVDRNDKDYLKLNNIAKFDSYPRIIILKPETPNNVKVVNSDFKINQKDADEMK